MNCGTGFWSQPRRALGEDHGSLQHLKCFVTRDGCDLELIQAFLEKAAGSFVPEVMESKSLNASALAQPSPSAL